MRAEISSAPRDEAIFAASGDRVHAGVRSCMGTVRRPASARTAALGGQLAWPLSGLRRSIGWLPWRVWASRSERSWKGRSWGLLGADVGWNASGLAPWRGCGDRNGVASPGLSER